MAKKRVSLFDDELRILVRALDSHYETLWNDVAEIRAEHPYGTCSEAEEAIQKLMQDREDVVPLQNMLQALLDTPNK